jgi:uncharacterized membrane protein HdeD (DUF308 family)
VGVEGVALLLIGIYVIVAPDSARGAVRGLIGAFLLVNSVGVALAGLKTDLQTNPITPYRMLAAGVGISVGTIVLLQSFSDYISDDGARVILAIGLLVYGAVGLIGAYETRASGGMRRGAILTSVLDVVFAVILLYDVRNDKLDPRWFGYAALACGVLVCGYAFALYRAAPGATVTAAASAE